MHICIKIKEIKFKAKVATFHWGVTHYAYTLFV